MKPVNEEGESESRPGQIQKAVKRKRKLRRIEKGFKRCTKGKQSRRKAHMQRKRVPKSRGRKRTTARTRFQRRDNEQRSIGGPEVARAVRY